MKQLMLFNLLCLASQSNAMNFSWASLQTDILLTIILHPNSSNELTSIQMIDRIYKEYALVNAWWHIVINQNKNKINTHLSILPIHFAAYIDDWAMFYELKMSQKKQVYELDENENTIIDYARGKIKSALLYIDKNVPEKQDCKKINCIIHSFSENIQKKYAAMLAVLKLEKRIHVMLDSNCLNEKDTSLFDVLDLLGGNLNARANNSRFVDRQYSFLEKICMCQWKVAADWANYLLSFRQVQEHIIQPFNASKALEYCVDYINIPVLQSILAVPRFDITIGYPFFGCYIAGKIISNESICKKFFAFLDILSIDWEQKEKQKGYTPLLIAVAAQNISMCEWLIKVKKVNVNAQDNNGNTALHIIFKKAGLRVEAITLLLQAGADLTLKNNAGQLPKECAKHQLMSFITNHK